MMARIAAAPTITHFAHIVGPQKMAKTTMPKARIRRQKHNFMIPISFSLRFSYHTKKNIKVQAKKSIREKNQNSVQRFLLL
jgi:hypothetical protein